MKKVIDGKVYNTETSRGIADWSNGLGHGDFYKASEALYITRNKRFFVHGSGGPCTLWGKRYGNAMGSGDDIIVLSTDDALEWCERHDIDADIIEKYFDVQEA